MGYESKKKVIYATNEVKIAFEPSYQYIDLMLYPVGIINKRIYCYCSSDAFGVGTISLPFGNNSLLSTFHSINGRPGPVTRSVTAIDKYNKFN
jgi:hypothetical protein